MRDTIMRVERHRHITKAIAETLWWSNIGVEVLGDTSQYHTPGKGVLFIGDHRNGLEFVPLLAHFGDLERDDVHIVAKPFSTLTKVLSTLDPYSEGLTLPVIPRTLARDRKNKLNRDIYWRLTNRGELPSKEELKMINSNTIQSCVQRVIEGHAVILFPTGGVMDASKNHWRQGLGQVVRQIPEWQYPNVTIVPFRFDDFSKRRLTQALLMRSHGVYPKRQEINLRLGRQGTVRELIGDMKYVQSLQPLEISNLLQRQFIQSFASRSS